MSSINLHASCIAYEECGLLIRGPSGSGKSDLVLRMLDEPNGAMLVADDQVLLAKESGVIFASAPPILAGLLEIRGHGIVKRPFLAKVKLSHIIDLNPSTDITRMPEPSELQAIILDQVFPRLKLYSFQASAPARIRAFLHG